MGGSARAAGSTPTDFGFWLRFAYARVLTYSSTLRSRARQSLAKSPNLVGGSSFGLRKNYNATRGRITCWR